MSNTEVDERVNLKDIIDISEDEFKRQISAWIDERGISRKLQSKLRADLFEQFNKTKLGRQMAEQHQLAHRIVLSPLILVLNTLVAEFLCIEDCHFTLSVFSNEVPYKNTLPNFEETPSRQLFRFSTSELNDIFEAIGFSKRIEKKIRELYLKVDRGTSGQEALNKSLLYCILKVLISHNDRVHGSSKSNAMPKKPKPSTSKAIVSTSSQQSCDPTQSSNKKSSSSDTGRVNRDSLQISSRYFKYLNRYLEILSDRINDMSKSLAEKGSECKIQKTTADSSIQEESLRKDLRKIIHNISKLTKSQRKSKRYEDVLNTIERLSASVEKCSGKLEELLMAVNVQSQSKMTNAIEKKLNDKNDRFSDMDYSSWLRELKTSENGRKFIDRLEISLQKTMEKERENLEKLYEEKTNNYRMLIRLHYKQKYDMNKSNSETKDNLEKNDSSPKITPDNTEKSLAETLAKRALEKEKQVDDIVQTAKVRLQQLERESDELDQSFQAYLRRQQIAKQQVNADASKIWEHYSASKAALAQFDKIDDKKSIVGTSRPFKEPLKIDQIFNSTFYDDIDIADVLKDLNEIRRLKSPQFNKNEAFPKDSLLMHKSEKKSSKSLNDHNDDNWFENLLMTQKREKSVTKLSKLASIEFDKTDRKRQIVQNGIENETGKGNGNGKNKTNTKSKFEIEKPKSNHIAISNEAQTKPMENGEVEKQVDPKKQVENGNDSENRVEKSTEINAQKSPEMPLEMNKNTVPFHEKLMNGHGIEKTIEKHTAEIAKVKKSTEQKKENENIFSPLKINGFNHVEKPITIPVSNGLKKAPEIVTNVFGSKSVGFVSKISDSDSVELESEQISIGQQRIIKSPDDFWI